MPVAASDVVVTMRNSRETALGPALAIKVFAPDYRPLAWDEVHDAFVRAFPGKWAVEVFPPEDALVNGKAVRHLWVLDDAPRGLDIREG